MRKPWEARFRLLLVTLQWPCNTAGFVLNAARSPTFYEFDLSKPRRLIGFTPTVDIFQMIDDALAFRRGENIGVLPTG